MIAFFPAAILVKTVLVDLKKTKASIANKLARGTFPATFFLACLAALELDGVALEEI